MKGKRRSISIRVRSSFVKKIKLTMEEKINLFLWLHRGEEYLFVIERNGMIFKLTDDQGWVTV